MTDLVQWLNNHGSYYLNCLLIMMITSLLVSLFYVLFNYNGTSCILLCSDLARKRYAPRLIVAGISPGYRSAILIHIAHFPILSTITFSTMVIMTCLAL